VATALDDPALAQDKDLVGILHRRQPMGDHKRRPALQGGKEGFLDRALRFRVEMGRRLIEDDDGRRLQ